MKKALTRASIIREVCKQTGIKNNKAAFGGFHIWLWKKPGDNYWWFHYDINGIYDTHTVYVMYLCDMSFEQWINEGVKFVNKMKEKQKGCEYREGK